MLDRNEVLSMNILIAGGTGYIGSHICVELLESGHDVVVIDDFSNSKPDVLDSIYKITGKHVKFYEFNVLDEEKTDAVRGIFKYYLAGASLGKIVNMLFAKGLSFSTGHSK